MTKPSQGKIFGGLIFLIIFSILIWFTFGWLYGPKPSINTLSTLVSSYFRSNTQNSDSNLVQAPTPFSHLRIPPGFSVQVFAQNLGGPNFYIPGVNWGVRQMAVKNQTVYATIHKEGKVVALADSDQDGRADIQRIFLENLSLPHGIEVYQDWVYVAQNNRLIRVKDADSDGQKDGEIEKVLDLPPLLEHWTRTVRIFQDPQDNQPYMFVSIGSSCNACNESNPWRAAIIRCTLEGKNCQVYAQGLRNTVDFVLFKNQMYATDAGKDFLGNDIPPEEVNVILQGKNYGWPYCYGKQIRDDTFDRDSTKCPQTEPSFVDLPAHSTAIGINGYSGNQFPKEYQNSLFVALHGSYQSKPPVGYKVVRIDLETNRVYDFIDGFAGNNWVYGRPVHIQNYQNGLLISDDKEGKIYLVTISR